VILGNTELALDEPRDEDGVRHNLQQILKASKRPRDLIRQILTFSRKSDRKRKPVEVAPS
jgi:signal transduction histidine kinase